MSKGELALVRYVFALTLRLFLVTKNLIYLENCSALFNYSKGSFCKDLEPMLV